jgi:HSP20 family protein
MSLLPIRRMGNMLDLADDMDLMLDPWTSWPSSYRVQDGFWHPTTNVYDRDSEIVVELELPGVEEKDINVSAEDDELVIKGIRHRPTEYRETEEYISEMSYGKFHRIIDLPGTVDTDNVKARFKGGMLTVTLPKKQKERGKKILLEAA